MEYDPFAVLGLTPRATDDAVERAYEQRFRALPPHAAGRGAPERERLEDAVERIAEQQRRSAAAGLQGTAGVDVATPKVVVATPPGAPSEQTAAPRRRTRAAEAPADVPKSEEEVVCEIKALERRATADRLEKLEADCAIGALYKDARKRGFARRAKLTQKAWVEQKLEMSYSRAAECLKVFELGDEVFEADRWFIERGHSEGWRAKNPTGARYGIEVVQHRRDAREGKRPGDVRVAGSDHDADAPAGRRAAADLRRAVEQREAEIAELEEARAALRHELVRAEGRADALERKAGRLRKVAKRFLDRATVAEARLRELGSDTGSGAGPTPSAKSPAAAIARGAEIEAAVDAPTSPRPAARACVPLGGPACA